MDRDLLLESLPRSFSFYHLGRIELREPSVEPGGLQDLADPGFLRSVDRSAVAFSFQGELQGVLLLLFDEGLDVSTYSEAGNIIASRLAAAVSRAHGLEITLSPPRRLSRNQLKRMLQGGKSAARTYVHRHGDRSVTLQAVWLQAAGAVSVEAAANRLASMEGMGNA